MNDPAPSSPDLTATTAAYGRWAERYIELVGTAERAPQEDRAAIAAWADELHGPVLDVGSGPGHWTAFLHDRGLDAEGIDATPEFVDHARRTHPTVRFRLGDLRDLDCAPSSLSGILAWFSLIHTDPAAVPAVLRRFATGLRPGGSVLVGFFAGERLERFDHRVVTAWAWPVTAMSGVLADAGLEVLDAREWRTPNGRRNAAARARRAG